MDTDIKGTHNFRFWQKWEAPTLLRLLLRLLRFWLGEIDYNTAGTIRNINPEGGIWKLNQCLRERSSVFLLRSRLVRCPVRGKVRAVWSHVRRRTRMADRV